MIEPRRGREPIGGVIGGQERFDFEAQRLVLAAGGAQKRVPLACIVFERRREDGLGVIPSFLVHVRPSSSHATAMPVPSPSRA